MQDLDIQQKNPDTLHFDFKNPRIAEFDISNDAPEEEIIKILWDVMGVEEIVLSIKASGFFFHEPLIALEENGRNIVIEGNRRLAAVKCLLHPDLADYIGFNKGILSLTAQEREKLQEIPVIFVESREVAWKFIGFKHINGPAKWGSYAKAQYISEIHNQYHVSLADIALQIGDTHKTVQKLYQGLQVIEQAESKGVFERSDIIANRLYFSHLYTALAYEGYREFLGLKDVSEETKNPVPADKLENLGDTLTWLYGSRKRDKDPLIKSQNPDLRYLEAVIKSKEAIHAIKDGYPLYYAYEVSQPKNETFAQSLLDAKRSLQKSQANQTEGFDGSDESLLRQAGTIAQMAEELYAAMVAKYNAFNNKGQKQQREFTEE